MSELAFEERLEGADGDRVAVAENDIAGSDASEVRDRGVVYVATDDDVALSFVFAEIPVGLQDHFVEVSFIEPPRGSIPAFNGAEK